MPTRSTLSENESAAGAARMCRSRSGRRPDEPLPRRRRLAASAPVTKLVPLDFVETSTFGSRVIYERCGRARDESD
jgi:hypothetical protein